MDFTGKNVLVTGGSRGIGRGVVEAFAKRGANVAFVYHSNSQAAEEVCESLKDSAGKIVSFQCDVSSKSAVDEVVDTLVKDWEKIDILVNNAGVIRDGLLAMMPEEDWVTVMTTNLNSVYNFCHAVVRPMMSERYGRIINMSSVAANFANPGQSNYAASKGGIEGFTKCLATEIARRNITVNAVAPGFIETDMTQAVRNAAEAEIKKHVPCRRLGKPEDIANAVLFLASDMASYITGEVIKVDGGLTLGGM